MLIHLVSLLLCLNFLRVLCEQAPVIVFISPDQQKFIGDTVEFTCVSTYNPAYAVFWKKDMVILSNNTLVYSKDSRFKIKHISNNNSYTLSLENIQESDKGEYRCELQRMIDKIAISDKTNLIVLVEVPSSFKPKFTSKAINKTVKAGDTVILPCDVDRLGDDYVLLWKKDTSVLTAAHLKITQNTRVELLENWHLKISRIMPEDEGMYICQVSTETPMELKHLVLLEAAPLTSIVTSTSKIIISDVIKVAGEDLHLICQATGNPTPRIMWKKMNGRLPNEEMSSTNPVLRVDLLSKEHSGQYICTASNGVGKDSSASFTLHIEFSPIVHSPKTRVITGIGLEAQLYCEFEVFPLASLIWLINGKKIDDQFRYTMSDESPENGKQISTLKITSITEEDFGNYTCSGTNRFGTSKAVIELTGMSAPLTVNKGKTSSRSSNFHIDWTVKSYSPIIEYVLRLRKVDKMTRDLDEWISRPIKAENRDGPDQFQTYDISNLEPETTYQVIMNAKNEYGWNPDSNILEFTTSSEKDINATLLNPRSELDVAVEPEQSQQPGSAMPNKNQSTQIKITYLLTIIMLITFFWL